MIKDGFFKKSTLLIHIQKVIHKANIASSEKGGNTVFSITLQSTETQWKKLVSTQIGRDIRTS